MIKIAFAAPDYGGKDTALSMIQERYYGMSFSDSLKKIASSLFPFMEFDYEPRDKETKIIHTNPETGEEFTPRKLWEKLDILPQIDPEVFIRPLEIELEICPRERVCIKDIRRPAELEFCIKNNFKILFIDTDDKRWHKRLAEDTSFIVQYRNEIRKKANYVFMNSKQDPNWEKNFRYHLSTFLMQCGDLETSEAIQQRSV